MDNFADNESTEETIEKDSVTGESMAELMDLYEESFKRFAEGEVVNGKIISVDKATIGTSTSSNSAKAATVAIIVRSAQSRRRRPRPGLRRMSRVSLMARGDRR